MPRYHLGDHLGGVEAVTDDVGTLAARYAFDPWGGRTLAAGAEVTDVVFPGHLRHTSSGLHLTWHRALDPVLGRWLSEDPLGGADGPNLFAYVRNRPVQLTDPLGLCSCGDECQSGKWRLHSVSVNIGSLGLGFSFGAGLLACEGALTVARRVKVFCAPQGVWVFSGVAASIQVRGTALDGPCNRREIQEFSTKGWVASFGVATPNRETIDLSLGPGGGVAWVPCRVVPW